MLHCAPRHCSVQYVRLIPRDLCALNLNFLRSHQRMIIYE